MALFEFRNWNMDEFKRIRTSPEMAGQLAEMGVQWVERLNEELRVAQAARKQPVEDGYDYTVTNTGSRARLFVVAKTARAQAHEAEHSSMLKQMATSGLTPKIVGKAENPNRRSTDSQGNPIVELDG